MSMLQVTIKHGGKTCPVTLDAAQPPSVFKKAIFELTGVQPELLKVMTKTCVLKAGQMFMVVGAAGELPKAPGQPVVFLEDMGDTELVEALKMPAGLANLGKTCYMNATLQTLRAIPELQTALQTYTPPAQGPPNPGARLTASLRHTFDEMQRTADGFTPAAFLTLLRQLVPQFARRSQHGPGFAQQDAEECWTQIVNYLSALPGTAGALPHSPLLVHLDGQPLNSDEHPVPPQTFVEQYMMGMLSAEITNLVAPEESVTRTVERFKTAVGGGEVDGSPGGGPPTIFGPDRGDTELWRLRP